MGVEQGEGLTLEIAVPYLAATYDERMFEEPAGLQLFQRRLRRMRRGFIDPEHVVAEHRR